jgi:glycosyltransferase involved in cell wall biosynthesis
MRIALVTGYGVMPQNGGQGSFCADLAKGMLRRGHEVTAVTINGAMWDTWAREEGVTRLRIVQPSLRALRHADIVHLNNPGLRMLLMARFLGKPTVVTHMGFFAICPEGIAWPTPACGAGPTQLGPCRTCRRQSWIRRAHLHLQAWLLRRAVNVGVSRRVAERLSAQEAIMGPFDLGWVPDFSQEPVESRIAYIGRLVPEKGVDVVIRALAELPNVSLDVYGDGDHRGALEAQAAQLGLATRVCFHGLRDRPILALRHAAALVVPSLWDEALGYVTIEGMAAGKAVIGAATGATVDLLADDRGWLVPPGQHQPLVQAVAYALADDAERQRRGRRAREFVQTMLEPVHVAQEYERAYGRAL